MTSLTTIETPADLAAQGAELISWASTENAGLVAGMLGRQRWIELSVWFLHSPKYGGKPWVAQAAGMSRVEGEGARVTRLASGTLERALKIIDTTDMGVAVAEQAREWEEDNPVAVQNAKRGPVSFDNDREALAWLYGDEPMTSNSFPRLVARDLGAGMSTVRMQLGSGRPVMVPLREVLPFIDRAAFRRARETARG